MALKARWNLKEAGDLIERNVVKGLIERRNPSETREKVERLKKYIYIYKREEEELKSSRYEGI